MHPQTSLPFLGHPIAFRSSKDSTFVIFPSTVRNGNSGIKLPTSLSFAECIIRKVSLLETNFCEFLIKKRPFTIDLRGAVSQDEILDASQIVALRATAEAATADCGSALCGADPVLVQRAHGHSGRRAVSAAGCLGEPVQAPQARGRAAHIAPCRITAGAAA